MGQPPWGNGNGSRDASLVALSFWARMWVAPAVCRWADPIIANMSRLRVPRSILRELFLAGPSPGSDFVASERDGGLYGITGGSHEGTGRPDLYARYIGHARFRTTKRDIDVQRECLRRASGTRSGIRASAGLIHATGQTGNFSSRQTAHQIQAFRLMSCCGGRNERMTAVQRTA
jgi:hypothetical protein